MWGGVCGVRVTRTRRAAEGGTDGITGCWHIRTVLVGGERSAQAMAVGEYANTGPAYRVRCRQSGGRTNANRARHEKRASRINHTSAMKNIERHGAYVTCYRTLYTPPNGGPVQSV